MKNLIINNKSGFTLVELLISTVVFSFAFIGLLLSFVRSMELHEASRNTSFALTAVKSRLETIQNTTFSEIYSTYDGLTFTDSGLNGIGVSYVDNSNLNLLEVVVPFCWQQKNGRIIGEDANLDGALDAGEDANLNGRIDSPAQVITYIYNRD